MTRHNSTINTISKHAGVRLQQRGITPTMLSAALTYGLREWSHGAILCQVTDRALRGTPLSREGDRLRGLVLVLSRDGTLITAKWDRKLSRPGPARRQNLA
jgi:hypothetical protein